MNTNDLQEANFNHLKQIVNNQIDINNCITEGDIYDADSVLPLHLVNIGLLSYQQYLDLFEHLYNEIYFK